MKNNLLLLLLSFVSIPILNLANTAPTGIPLSMYSFKTLELSLSKPVLGEIVLLPKETIAEEDAVYMIKNLEKIDQHILMLAAEQNIKVKLFDGSLTDQKGLRMLKNERPRGYASDGPNWQEVPGMYEDRIVYAKIGHSQYGRGHGSVSLELHEFGHSLDRHVFNYVRKDPLFLSIWKQEAKSLFENRTYFINFPEEYFAESFAMYYLSEATKDLLFKKAPLTYKYMNSLETRALERANKKYVLH
ncbi:toxin [Metabacillus herbersteinensis]|uniref:Toxin n=1 Tax=Metabacillus herbersteinensis TaxID=283816 RepID=A0ABV6GKZ2_9BACI